MHLKATSLLVGLCLPLLTQAANSPSTVQSQLKREIVRNYTQMAEANYEDALKGAKKLDQRIGEFVRSAAQIERPLPSLQKKFSRLKSTWKIQARWPYGQSEIFRFYNGPIDFEPINDGVTSYLESIDFQGVEGLLNAWPLDEAYIDYVQGAPNAGIINDRSQKLTKDFLALANERQGEKNISTGYHAIEFLLWGQDRSLVSAGDRPLSDYVGENARNQDRRRKYLSLTSELLVEHLKSVTEQWQSEEVNFRQEFVDQAAEKSLGEIMTSLIAMAGDELKSERIENALLLGDQEEEQSCFSDATINDIYTNAQGMKNLYQGTYRSLNFPIMVKGKGIGDLLAKVSPELHQQIEHRFEKLFTAIHFFYKKDNQGHVRLGDIALPFDVAITENKKRVQAIVDELYHLDELFRKAAAQLGVKKSQ